MDVFLFGMAAILGTVGGAVGFASATFRYLERDLRRMRRRPATAIRDVARPGMVKLAGQVRLVGPGIVAPLSGRRCAAYAVNLWASSPDRRGATSDPQVVRIRVATDFLLDDGTGKALIGGGGAHFYLRRDAPFLLSPGQTTGPNVQALLASVGMSRQAVSLGLFTYERAIRFEEGVLEADAEVSAIGFAGWEPDPEPDFSSTSGGYREAPQRLALRSNAHHAAFVSHRSCAFKEPQG